MNDTIFSFDLGWNEVHSMISTHIRKEASSVLVQYGHIMSPIAIKINKIPELFVFEELFTGHKPTDPEKNEYEPKELDVNIVYLGWNTALTRIHKILSDYLKNETEEMVIQTISNVFNIIASEYR